MESKEYQNILYFEIFFSLLWEIRERFSIFHCLLTHEICWTLILNVFGVWNKIERIQMKKYVKSLTAIRLSICTGKISSSSPVDCDWVWNPIECVIINNDECLIVRCLNYSMKIFFRLFNEKQTLMVVEKHPIHREIKSQYSFLRLYVMHVTINVSYE